MSLTETELGWLRKIFGITHYPVITIEFTSLLTEIYDRAWAESPVLPLSRRFVLPYLPQLMKADKLELLVYSFKNFDRGENESFLLCIPELWEFMKIEDWTNLINLLSPRPIITVFDSTGCYSDIIFFIKWLNLDGLQFALSLDSLNAEDKQQICHYCRANVSFLQRDHEDFEDFDGKILCLADSLLNYRSKLLAQEQNLLPTYSDLVSFQNYVDGICHQYFAKDV
ncbi:MAG: hypothetical protein ACM37W_12780 [Actinomycetota bacterium]